MITLRETCIDWIILNGEPYHQGQLPNKLEQQVEAHEKIIFEKVSKVRGSDNFNRRTLRVLMETAKELGLDQPYGIALQTKFKLDKMVAEIKSFDENFDFDEMFSGLKRNLEFGPFRRGAYRCANCAQNTDWERFPLKFWETQIDLDLGNNEGKFMYECKDYVLKRVIHGYSVVQSLDEQVSEKLLNCASVEVYVDENLIKVDTYVDNSFMEVEPDEQVQKRVL